MRLAELLSEVPGVQVVGPAEAEIAGVEHDAVAEADRRAGLDAVRAALRAVLGPIQA